MSNTRQNVPPNTRQNVENKEKLALDIVGQVVYIIVSDLELPYVDRIPLGMDTITRKLLNVVHPYDKILSKLLIYNPLNTLRANNKKLELIKNESVRPYNEYKRLLNARQKNMMLENSKYATCERRYKSSVKKILDTPWFKRLENTIVSEIGAIGKAGNYLYRANGGIKKQLRDTIGLQLLKKYLCKKDIQSINKKIISMSRTYRYQMQGGRFGRKDINLKRNREDRTTEAIDILESLIDKGELLRAIFLQLGKCDKMNTRNLINQRSVTSSNQRPVPNSSRNNRTRPTPGQSPSPRLNLYNLYSYNYL